MFKRFHLYLIQSFTPTFAINKGRFSICSSISASLKAKRTLIKNNNPYQK